MYFHQEQKAYFFSISIPWFIGSFSSRDFFIRIFHHWLPNDASGRMPSFWKPLIPSAVLSCAHGTVVQVVPWWTSWSANIGVNATRLQWKRGKIRGWKGGHLKTWTLKKKWPIIWMTQVWNGGQIQVSLVQLQWWMHSTCKHDMYIDIKVAFGMKFTCCIRFFISSRISKYAHNQVFCWVLWTLQLTFFVLHPRS